VGEHVIGGRYRLVSVLGRVARITTYEAETTDTRERVVVRGIPTPDETSARAAEQEAEARARLTDPALPRVRAHVGDALNGVRGRFIVEERTPNAETAAATVAKRGALPEAEVIAIARALLGALAYLHASGFSHANISPEQILLAPGGRVVLVDWGTAASAQAALPSPESARGDPAADLRALGTTLALLLVGRAVDPARAADEVRPRAPRLAAWIGQLVADPPRRFPSARSALDGLASATRENVLATTPRWALVFGAAVPVLIVATVLATILLKRSQAESRAEEALLARDRDIEARRDQIASLTLTNIGCADGTREAFKDILAYPRIAGCSGAFKVPGILESVPPSCGRGGGNDGKNPLGSECNASDLCAERFHVCASAAEVAERSTNGCAGARDAPAATFFATRQSGPGCFECATGGDPNCEQRACHAGCAPGQNMADDLFGCGNVGSRAKPSCAPLDRTSGNTCVSIGSSWHCRGGTTFEEAVLVTKPETTGGGVLCCED
jgi:hypothetical protein